MGPEWGQSKGGLGHKESQNFKSRQNRYCSCFPFALGSKRSLVLHCKVSQLYLHFGSFVSSQVFGLTLIFQISYPSIIYPACWLPGESLMLLFCLVGDPHGALLRNPPLHPPTPPTLTFHFWLKCCCTFLEHQVFPQARPRLLPGRLANYWIFVVAANFFHLPGILLNCEFFANKSTAEDYFIYHNA